MNPFLYLILFLIAVYCCFYVVSLQMVSAYWGSKSFVAALKVVGAQFLILFLFILAYLTTGLLIDVFLPSLSVTFDFYSENLPPFIFEFLFFLLLTWFASKIYKLRFLKAFLLLFFWQALVIGITVISVFSLKYFFPYYEIQSGSMMPTLEVGDVILVDRTHVFERQDIVFFYPDLGDSLVYSKRIIATPGDTVRLYQGKVFLNGSELNEPYIPSSFTTCLIAELKICLDDDKTFVVPPNSYFILGDNRNASVDSRSGIGFEKSTFLSDDRTIGSGWMRIYPFSKPTSL